MKNQLKRYVFLFVLVLFATTTVQAQKSKDILRQYKKGYKSHMITVPGFVAKIAINAVETEDEVKKVAKKVKSVRLFISEGGDNKKYDNMVSDLDAMFKKHDYIPLVQVKSDGDTVHIQFLPGTKKERGEFVILARSESEFVAVIIEGNFTKGDVSYLAKSIDVDDFR